MMNKKMYRKKSTAQKHRRKGERVVRYKHGKMRGYQIKRSRR